MYVCLAAPVAEPALCAGNARRLVMALDAVEGMLGTAWYCLVLLGTAWYCLVLLGTACFCQAGDGHPMLARSLLCVAAMQPSRT